MTYMESIPQPATRPMSDEQALLLRRLCGEAGQPGAYDDGLCAQRADRRIAGLIDEIRMRVLPPHTD